MSPSLRDRIAAWTSHALNNAILGRMGRPNAMERVKAAGEAARYVADDPRFLEALLHMLASDEQEVARFAAAESLECLSTAAISAAQRQQGVDALVAAFRGDRDPGVRVRAVRTLRKLGWTPHDASDLAMASAMTTDTESLRRLLKEGHRDLVMRAIAHELVQGKNTAMVSFMSEVGAGSGVVVDALETYLAQRREGTAGLQEKLRSLGITDAPTVEMMMGKSLRGIPEIQSVLTALRASLPAPAVARGVLRRVVGPTMFYRCPSCGTTLRKRSLAGIPDAVGFTTCSACQSSFSYADVYQFGRYDVPEVEGNCAGCGAVLRGPSAELAGKPCPSCGAQLPLESP